MKPTEKKREYIRLRAEGKSYRAIEAEIGVSRSTCSEWEKELRADIDQLKQDNLKELYTQYGMAREARIRRIGETLHRIDEALDSVDLSTLDPAKLLDFKLKYQAALREEYTAAADNANITGAANDTLEAIQDVYRRIASGDISTDQAKTELNVIDHMVDGYSRSNPFEMFTL